MKPSGTIFYGDLFGLEFNVPQIEKNFNIHFLTQIPESNSSNYFTTTF